MSYGQVMHDSISFPLYIQKRSGVWFSAEMRKIIETGDCLTDQHMSLAQEILKGPFHILMDGKVLYWCRLTDHSY